MSSRSDPLMAERLRFELRRAEDEREQFIPSNRASVQSVNGKTGIVTLGANEIGAVAEAPEDGTGYVRKDGAWAGSFTDADARSAAVENDIDPAETERAPSQSAVSAALADKENALAAGAASQFYRGDKVFSADLLGDMAVTKDLPAYRMFTPSKNVGYRFLGTINDAVDFGLGIDRWNGSAWQGMYAFQLFMMHPVSDNSASCGVSYARWSEVFSGTGVINTSDAREKYEVRALTENEVLAAVALSAEVRVYQWKEAVSRKGADGARWHAGLTVQRAIEIMESFGLDAFRYGFICFDSWAEAPEIFTDIKAVVDSAGNIIEPSQRVMEQAFRAAGDRYSFRLDQLSQFMIAGLHQRLSAIEQRKPPRVPLGAVTLKETATVAIAAGDRTLTIPVPGLAAGDDVLLFPTAHLPAGYLVKSVIATAANTLSVRLQVPLIALGASYSIPCRVVALR